MSERDDDREGLPLDALVADEPPAGFADGVMAAWAEEQAQDVAPSSRAPRRFGPLALAVAAAAAALAVVVVDHLPEGASAGSVLASAREEVAVGGRATVVAEAGADLSWRVARGGDVVVEQRKGRAFYRVEPGGSFVVKTPAGEARVTGTCFTLEIPDMSTRSLKKNLASAAAGAALAATVVLTVQEGSVSLANERGEIAVAAGERAHARAGDAPERVSPSERAQATEEENRLLAGQRRALRSQVDDLEEQLKQVMIARANGEDPLVAENRALKDQVARLREELRVEEELRSEREGEAVPFPEELPDAYREQALKGAFLDMLAKTGVPGDVVGIDCSEYPCVVFGEMEIKGDRLDVERTWNKFDGRMRELYPSEENNHWVSHSVHRDDKGSNKSMFGITIQPKSIKLDKAERKNVDTRLHQRNREFFDATWRNDAQ
jgi:hypothetical protein